MVSFTARKGSNDDLIKWAEVQVNIRIRLKIKDRDAMSL